MHSLSSAFSLFSHLKFGHYVMSPSYLAAFIHCLDVLFWRNAWSDYGYIFASSMVQFLGWSSTCPSVCNDRALVRQWRKLWVPQLHSSLVVAVPGWRVVQIFCCKCGGDSRLPQMQILRTCSWTRSLTCLCCATEGAWSSGAETAYSPQLQFKD